MVEVTSLGAQLVDFYKSLVLTLPVWLMDFVNLFLLVFLIVIYSVFVWKFYRLISTKNLIELNLSQYNRSEHPVLTKLLAGTLYFVEYIVVLPFLIFFWFGDFTIFLLFIIILEILLRSFDFIFMIFGLNEQEVED